MTDPNSQVPTPSSTESWFTPGRLNAQLVYGLYLVSFVVGISGIIVGLIVAYASRSNARPMAESHYTFLIRTFWIGLLYALVSSILAIFFFGLILLFATAIWIVVRCVIGLQKVSANQPIERPDSWWV